MSEAIISDTKLGELSVLKVLGWDKKNVYIKTIQRAGVKSSASICEMQKSELPRLINILSDISRDYEKQRKVICPTLKDVR